MEKERKYGIDLLRIVAAFMIIMFHSLTQGGVVDGFLEKTSNYYVSWFMLSFVMEGVDLFALVSGYVSFSDTPKKLKYSRLVDLWLTVVFYSLLSCLLFDIIQSDWVSPIDYLKAITPIINCTFWYFTVFIGLYIFKPILDNGIRMCEEKTLKKISILIIVFFSCLEFLTYSFGLSNGFSVMWIVALYIIGATIKKCKIEDKVNYKIPILIILVMGIITYLGGMFISDYSFMDIQISQRSLFDYNSPTIMISAICYLLIFSKIKINSKYGKIIKVLGMSTFSVYIVNCTDVFWNNVMNGLFSATVDYPVYKMVFSILSFSVIFVLFVLLFDILRRKLFTICGVTKLYTFIDNKF